MIAPAVMYVVMPILAATLALTFVRLARGPSLPDRVVALDLLSTVGVAVMAAYVVLTGETAYLDVALVVTLVTFLGTVALANYLEWR
ncbi:MAG: sodium/proton antiporter complex Mrp, protein [Chloroflexota bacterium]|jgi:multicomponent Na+:H+ antiporter subunit F